MFAVSARRTMASARFSPPQEKPKTIDWLALQKQRREEFARRNHAKLVEDRRVLDERRRQANEAIARARAVARGFHDLYDEDAVVVGDRYRPTMTRISERICRALKVTRADVCGSSRARPVVFARQAIMYWSRRLTKNSLPEIGRRMGNKDHTTVLHGTRTYVEKRARMGRKLRTV